MLCNVTALKVDGESKLPSVSAVCRFDLAVFGVTAGLYERFIISVISVPAL